MKCENCTKYKNGKCEHWEMVTKEDGYCHEFALKFDSDSMLIEKLKAIKTLYPDYKWLAMDYDGASCIFIHKPDVCGGVWVSLPFERLKTLDNYTACAWESLINIDEAIGGHYGRN